MPKISKTLVHFKKEKKRKSSAKIQKALVLKADFLHPSSPAGLPGMKATKLTGLEQCGKCEIF